MLTIPPPPPAVEAAPPPLLAFTGSNRFAVFADLASIRPEPDEGASVVRMRSLQISREDMLIGGVAYVGGWSWWRFNCAAWMADRLDFASLRADGTEGPVTPENAPPAPITPGQELRRWPLRRAERLFRRWRRPRQTRRCGSAARDWRPKTAP
ncbi:hypothetical protein [Brevundimonas naejangsanensis]|uniref:hypothetical protein n=1 Tax=Brevundimonas naejangsanensis TaxID=588932 RepID=UPI0026ECC1DE|nr:hypothetical protein [Brevundimonas naejangsanensis]